MNEQKSQNDAILQHLQSGRKISPLEALNDFGCMRLGARIWDLRQEGHEILDEWVLTPSKKQIKRYWMDVPADERQLRLNV